MDSGVASHCVLELPLKTRWELEAGKASPYLATGDAVEDTLFVTRVYIQELPLHACARGAA
jgi:hypothetical protein